jgi:hypothetical protein
MTTHGGSTASDNGALATARSVVPVQTAAHVRNKISSPPREIAWKLTTTATCTRRYRQRAM